MAVFRVEKTGDYTVMSNSHFREKGMSLKAKGLLSLMLFLPENWDYSVKGLCTVCKDGRSVVEQAIKELEGLGYLRRKRNIDEKGRFAGYTYDVYESPELQPSSPFAEKPLTEKPLTEKPSTEKPSTEKPLTEKPSTENPEQTNTYINNILNKQILNKQILTHSTHADTGAPARKKRTDQGARAVNHGEFSTFDTDEFYAAAIANAERILEQFAAGLEVQDEKES